MSEILENTSKNHESLLRSINQVLPLIAIIIGTIGETLSLIVYCDKKFLATSFSFFNITVTIVDILLFYIGYLRFYLQAVYIDPVSTSIYWCKILRYLSRPLLEIVSWIQIVMTLDRYLYMKHPNHFPVFRKTWFQFVVFLLLSLFFLIFHIPVAIFYGHYDYYNSTNTSISLVCFPDEGFFYISEINDFGLFFLFCLIPFSIMAYLTISISIIFIKKKHKTQANISRKHKKEYRFAFAIIFQNIIFLVLTLPQSSLWPVISLHTAGLLNFTTEYLHNIMEILHASFNFLLYMYFSLKFVVNLIFNSLYREIFFNKFLFCFAKKKQYVSHQQNSKTT